VSPDHTPTGASEIFSVQWDCKGSNLDPTDPAPEPPPGDDAEPDGDCTGSCTWEWTWGDASLPGSGGEYKVTSNDCSGEGCGCIWPGAWAITTYYGLTPVTGNLTENCEPTTSTGFTDCDISAATNVPGLKVSGSRSGNPFNADDWFKSGTIRSVTAPCRKGGAEPPVAPPPSDDCEQEACIYRWSGEMDPFTGTPATYMGGGGFNDYFRYGGTVFFGGLDPSKLDPGSQGSIVCCWPSFGNKPVCQAHIKGCTLDISGQPRDMSGVGSGPYGPGDGYALHRKCGGVTPGSNIQNKCGCDTTHALYKMAEEGATQQWMGNPFGGSSIDQATGAPKNVEANRLSQVSCVTADEEAVTGDLEGGAASVVDGASDKAHAAPISTGEKPVKDDIVSVDIPTRTPTDDVNTESGHQNCMESNQNSNAVQQVTNQAGAGCFDCPPRVGQRLVAGTTVSGVSVGDSDGEGGTYAEGDCVVSSSSEFTKGGSLRFDKQKYVATALTEVSNFQAMQNDKNYVQIRGGNYPEQRYPSHDTNGNAIENTLDNRRRFRSKGNFLSGFTVDDISVTPNSSNKDKYDITISYRNRNNEPARDPVVQQAVWNETLSGLNNGSDIYLAPTGIIPSPDGGGHGRKTDRYPCKSTRCIYKFIVAEERYELSTGCGKATCECDPEAEVVQLVASGKTGKHIGDTAAAKCVKKKPTTPPGFPPITPPEPPPPPSGEPPRIDPPVFEDNNPPVAGSGGSVGTSAHLFGNQQIKKPGPDGWAIAAGSSPTTSTTWKPPAFQDIVPEGIPEKAPTSDTHDVSENTSFYKPSVSGQIVIDPNGNVVRISESSYKGRIAYGKMTTQSRSMSVGAESLLIQHIFASQHEAETDATSIGLTGSHSIVMSDGATIWLPGSNTSFTQWFRNNTFNTMGFGSETASSSGGGTTSGSGGTGGSTGTSSTGSSSSGSGY